MRWSALLLSVVLAHFSGGPAALVPAVWDEFDEYGPQEVRADQEAGLVSRYDRAGKALWAVQLGGKLADLAWDRDRVYVAHGDGVTALDFRTGLPQWHSRGPRDNLLLGEGLLLATGPAPGDDYWGRDGCLLARSVRD